MAKWLNVRLKLMEAEAFLGYAVSKLHLFSSYDHVFDHMLAFT